MIPRSLQRFVHLIADVSDERASGSGWWVYLRPGYVSASTGTHCVHEMTLRECAADLANVVSCAAYNDGEACGDCAAAAMVDAELVRRLGPGFAAFGAVIEAMARHGRVEGRVVANDDGGLWVEEWFHVTELPYGAAICVRPAQNH